MAFFVFRISAVAFTISRFSYCCRNNHFYCGLVEYFQNKLVDTIRFMEILNLKDSVEKDSFFRKLPNLAEQLPRQIVLKKVTFKLAYAILNFISFSQCSCILFIVVLQFLPLLASALEFGSAAAPALTALLKMGSWLSTKEFSVKVLFSVFTFYCNAFTDYALFVQSLSSALDTFQLF